MEINILYSTFGAKVLFWELFPNFNPRSEGVPMVEKKFNPFFRVPWLISSLEKWLLYFCKQNLIFANSAKFFSGVRLWFLMVFDTLTSKRAFKFTSEAC
jgi:hypothetical protein